MTRIRRLEIKRTPTQGRRRLLGTLLATLLLATTTSATGEKNESDQTKGETWTAVKAWLRRGFDSYSTILLRELERERLEQERKSRRRLEIYERRLRRYEQLQMQRKEEGFRSFSLALARIQEMHAAGIYPPEEATVVLGEIIGNTAVVDLSKPWWTRPWPPLQKAWYDRHQRPALVIEGGKHGGPGTLRVLKPAWEVLGRESPDGSTSGHPAEAPCRRLRRAYQQRAVAGTDEVSRSSEEDPVPTHVRALWEAMEEPQHLDENRVPGWKGVKRFGRALSQAVAAVETQQPGGAGRGEEHVLLGGRFVGRGRRFDKRSLRGTISAHAYGRRAKEVVAYLSPSASQRETDGSFVVYRPVFENGGDEQQHLAYKECHRAPRKDLTLPRGVARLWLKAGRPTSLSSKWLR